MWGFIGFWTLLGFWIFYLNEQLGSLLVDVAQLISLAFTFTSTLSKICKFITYWLLEAINIKKSSIITGVTN